MVAPVVSSQRKNYIRNIAQIKALPPELPPTNYLELDSHADTTCAGANCRIIEYTDKACHVSAFSQHYGELENIPVVKAGTAYDAPTGETFILVLGQALYLGDYIGHSLLCPNQARANGVIIDDVPIHLAFDPHLATHSIYFSE